MSITETIRSGFSRVQSWLSGPTPVPVQTQTVTEQARSYSAESTQRRSPRPIPVARYAESANPRSYLGTLSEQHRNDEIQEANYDPFDVVDMREPFFDDGYQWLSPGVPGIGLQGQPNLTWHGFATEDELSMAQSMCRRMVTYSEFVVNGLHNRVNYTVGPGYRFKVVAKDADESSEAAVEALQSFVDSFLKRNRWLERQKETILRHDRDGECFRRLFRRPDGMTDVRFVEPWQVANPPGKNPMADGTLFGIRTVEGDNETPEAYYVRPTPSGVDFEEVEAADIQHLKCRADLNQRRGVPLFWVARFNVRRAYKTLQNIASKSEIAAAIPFTRKHVGGTSTSASAFAGSLVTNSFTAGGNTTNQTKYGPGTILDHSDRTEYEGTNFAQGMDLMIQGLAQMLRAMAAAGEMPEFMFSVDASNGNFASTLVAEGPVVKSFQSMQAKLRDADLWIIDEAIEHAMSKGLLPSNVLELCDIQVDLPEIATRDKDKEVQADKIKADAGILSPQTWCSKNDLDYDQEIENIEAHKAKGLQWPPVPAAAAVASPVVSDDGGNPMPGKPDDKLPDNAEKDDGQADGMEGLRTPEELFAEIERRYSDFVKQEGSGEGKWVTIRGVHVQIGKDGTIINGPDAMVGKKPDDIGDSNDNDDGPRSPKSDHAAAFIDTWKTNASGSRSGEFDKAKADAEAFVDGGGSKGIEDLYAETQAGLKKQGIADAKLYRGIAIASDHPLAKAILAGKVKQGCTISVDGAKAVSYSERKGVAEQFAYSRNMQKQGGKGVGIVLERVVDAKDVIASHRVHDGFIESEREWIAMNKGKSSFKVVGIELFGQSESVSESADGEEFDLRDTDDQRGIGNA